MDHKQIHTHTHHTHTHTHHTHTHTPHSHTHPHTHTPHTHTHTHYRHRVSLKYFEKFEKGMPYFITKNKVNINKCPDISVFLSLNERLHSTINILITQHFT